jgi:hypothetical protein
MRHEPYVPQAVGEILDHLDYMILSAPVFKDKTGYFPRENIETAFYSLNEGLQVVRNELGEEHYATLRTISNKMRALFESDPDDTTGDSQAGRTLIREMDDILADFAKRAASK